MKLVTYLFQSVHRRIKRSTLHSNTYPHSQYRECATAKLMMKRFVFFTHLFFYINQDISGNDNQVSQTARINNL